MKIVNTGNIYRIYDDNLKTYDELPAKTYLVCFNKMTGFYMEEQPDISVNEKIYGIHEQKVEKIISSFKMFERNLGVILSGAKGIGKSVCAKMLAQRAVKEGYPVIVCDQYIPGIANYISSIQQEVMVIFDEFDKTFKCNGSDEEGNQNDSQAEMLTLFDGLDQGKKLFIVTCNRLSNLNEFLVNRPGRFHYHLRFDYPTPEEIREYLEDKISKDKYDEIDKVISFAGRVDVNYDCLRAIAFELNLNLTFEDAIKDLNIVNTEGEDEYSATVVFKDGTKATSKRVYIDFYDVDDENKTIRFNMEGKYCYVEFDPSNSYYDTDHCMTIIKGSDVVDVEWHDSRGNDFEGNTDISYIAFKRKVSKNIHYMI